MNGVNSPQMRRTRAKTGRRAMSWRQRWWRSRAARECGCGGPGTVESGEGGGGAVSISGLAAARRRVKTRRVLR